MAKARIMDADERRRAIEEAVREIPLQAARIEYTPTSMLVNLAVGATLSGIGRATEHPELIATLPVLDTISGGLPDGLMRSPIETLLGYVPYAVGAALPYADKIYMALQSLN